MDYYRKKKDDCDLMAMPKIFFKKRGLNFFRKFQSDKHYTSVIQVKLHLLPKQGVDQNMLKTMVIPLSILTGHLCTHLTYL